MMMQSGVRIALARLVGGGGDAQLASGGCVNQPRPAGAKHAGGGGGEVGFEVVQAAKGTGDGFTQRIGGFNIVVLRKGDQRRLERSRRSTFLLVITA